MSPRTFLVAAAVLGLLFACRKGGPRRACDETLTIAPTKRLSALSTSEKALLCDRGVCQDSYGASTTCPDGMRVSSYPSQAACLAAHHWSACGDLALSDYLACDAKLNANPCDSLRIVARDPQCAAFKACRFTKRDDPPN